FVKRFAERANRLRVGDPTDPNTQVGALISQQHWEKVSGYIRLGIEEGATLLAGGADKPSDLPAHLKAGNFLGDAHTVVDIGQHGWAQEVTAFQMRRQVSGFF
ncbi:aldehyde dehydrogenase family protein, partial [Pseudomonas aeruginosa]|uniref:aldehyde dehydrogenase family protein n=1 Tax=Pseudomonas aeruginosa TaxID=287 RepID=UPI00300A71DE